MEGSQQPAKRRRRYDHFDFDLNVQNVFTKFDELESFVNRVNETHPISAICLNECWINDIDSMTGLNLPNYQMFFSTRQSTRT